MGGVGASLLATQGVVADQIADAVKNGLGVRPVAVVAVAKAADLQHLGVQAKSRGNFPETGRTIN